MRSLVVIGFLAAAAGMPPAAAQTVANLAALRGLGDIATLPATAEGRAALAANLRITGDIQAGIAAQPLLLAFPEQQRQALKDAFITDGNAAELADGLGSTLATAYRRKAHYTNGTSFTSVAPSLAALIGYTNNVTKADSAVAKYAFANATLDGRTRLSPAAAAILAAVGDATDVFGRAYGRRGGSPGADAFGNSRPFQTEPRLLAYRGADYFGRPSHSLDWLRGPGMNLTDSPSYPSGHTTYGYTESVLLAILVPERYKQMIARAAEYGHDRIVLGAHYAMDVIAGRAVALHAVAHLLANDPDYVGPARTNPAGDGMGAAGTSIAIADYATAMADARRALRADLEGACGHAIAVCARDDDGRFRTAAANAAFYASTQTYGLPAIHRGTAHAVEDVGKVAPEAGRLLTAAFPSLSLAEADAILTATEGPGGGLLDDGSPFGIYARIDLYAAAGRAAAVAARRMGTDARP